MIDEERVQFNPMEASRLADSINELCHQGRIHIFESFRDIYGDVVVTYDESPYKQNLIVNLPS